MTEEEKELFDAANHLSQSLIAFIDKEGEVFDGAMDKMRSLSLSLSHLSALLKNTALPGELLSIISTLSSEAAETADGMKKASDERKRVLESLSFMQ
ncbi:MAG: hypothetical protein ACI4S4_06370 [Candidatus Ornithospirochaeta sp.]